MKQVVSIGTQDFEFLRKNNNFFVDKSSFIKEWWEYQDAVTLLARPRRFGKTLNMSMLNCFFSNQYTDRGDLFEGLSIWEEEKYRALQGTYPVIFLSFANIKGSTYEETRKGIAHALVKLYSAHIYLKEKGFLNDKELEYFDSVRADMSNDVAVLALSNLSDYLSRYYGKKTLIFLDEYDTPLQEAYVQGYWDEMTAFIRSLFNSTFKTNPYMERAIMTGITRVSKESIFSDLNNLTVITATSEQYNTQFGFTEEEVFAALDAFDMSDRREEVKTWYDGFTFGSQKDIYNPWSITNFLKNKVCKTYWANTSGNSLVGKLIREASPDIKIAMEDLLAGKSIEAIIDEEIVFSQLDDNEDAIWSLLLASGYLKVDYVDLNDWDNIDGTVYELSLTNLEVNRMFRGMFRGWFKSRSFRCNDFLKALLSGDLKAMNHYMNKAAKQMISYFDTGKKPSEEVEPERFYHGFVLGLIAELGGEYRVTSNRESGFGRYDVMIEPKKPGEPAIVLEFKVHDPEDEKTLADTVQAALKQIEEKEYDTALIAAGIPEENIRHYGFAFEGKTVLIG